MLKFNNTSQALLYTSRKKESLKIDSISNINDSISLKVKKQYEKNPYPRWTNLGLSIEPKNIKDVFKYKNLDIDFQKINFSEKIEILISGCGTGQHALTTASVYKNANIYALDLSFNSLSYAKRKAKELDFKNIKFIQGDLLDIKKLNKKFDLIESVGVLHHMSDPFLGWKILTDCLKDNSFMWIGLYSKKAREHIAEIRKSIKELKIETTKYNIDSFRKKIFNDNSTKWNSLKNSPDFYSTSGIVDLLFHVQEHNFTIPIIREYMKTLNLFFLGFEDANIINKFKKIYNKPRDVYDLDKWHKFEIKNPKVFSGMYQFWCQK